MNTREHILAMEARCNAARLTIAQLCREVGEGCSRTLWWRWKQNVGSPRLDVWERVEAVVRRYEGS